MIIAKAWALFHADFPSDMIHEEGSEPVHGGKNVARAIGEILKGMGCKVEEPEYAGEHGWDFVFHHQRLKFWMQVSEWGSGHALHWLDLPPALGASDGASYFEFMLKLNERLKSDGRFHDIAWYSDDDVGSGQNGSEHPVIGELPKIPEIPASERKLSFIEKLLAPIRNRPSAT